MSIINITKDNFEREVINSDKPVLVDFWAAWCGPCMMAAPMINELSNELTNAKVVKINVEDHPEIARAYNIMNLPTFAVFNKGKVTNTIIGLRSKESLKQMINA